MVQLFNVWWEHHQGKEVKISELHSNVQTLADPANRGRQYLTAKIRNLVGTRLGGFVLTHYTTKGTWSADRYSLSQTKPAGVPDDDEGAL